MIVLVPLKRESFSLDGVGNKANTTIMRAGLLEGRKKARQVVPSQIGHQIGQFGIAAFLDQSRQRPLITEFIKKPLSPSRAALIGEGGIELIGTFVDPVSQFLAAGLPKRFLLQRSMFQNDYVPTERAEYRFKPFP